MKKYLFILIFSGLAAIASAQNASRDYTTAILWQQHSGEYRALCFQAYNFARLSLKESLWEASNGKPNCVIVDVDETVLDNSRFQGHELNKGVSYVQSDWTEWGNMAAADTVPGALSFLKFAAQKHVETFYVTNREPAEYAGTLKNLQKFGFPYADEAHLLIKNGTSDKEPRRKQVAEKYNILLLCGDNLSDFSNIFYREKDKDTFGEVDRLQTMFGTRFIVLPNPMYGDWEKPLYKGDNLTEEQKGQQRKARLKSY